MLQSAIEVRTSVLLYSMPRPQKRERVERVSTSFKVSERLRADMKVAAAKERRDMSDLVEDAFKAYLAKHHAAK
jgi:hypothetical protein